MHIRLPALLRLGELSLLRTFNYVIYITFIKEYVAF